MLAYSREVIRAMQQPSIGLNIGDLVKVDGWRSHVVWKVDRVYRRSGLVRLFDGTRCYRVLPGDCVIIRKEQGNDL